VKGRVIAFTVIHVAPAAWSPIPYAVVVVDSDMGWIVARTNEPDWLRVGAEVEVADGAARPVTG